MSNNIQATTNLTQTIYQYLWHEIQYLRLAPGTKLSEVKIARDFNCSRVPVREAIHLLVANDALEARPQIGSFVTYINLEQLEKVRYLRETLEQRILTEGLALGCFLPVLPYLEFLVSRQEELMLAKSYEMAFQLDTEFHRIFFKQTNREFVLEHTGATDIHYLRARLYSLQLDDPAAMPIQHRAIIEAIRNNNQEMLTKAIYDHLNNVNVVVDNFYISDQGKYFRRNQ